MKKLKEQKEDQNMVYQKQNNFFAKKWIYVIFRLILKNGKNKALNIVNKILLEILKTKKKLNFFFFTLNKNLCVPVILESVLLLVGKY